MCGWVCVLSSLFLSLIGLRFFFGVIIATFTRDYQSVSRNLPKVTAGTHAFARIHPADNSGHLKKKPGRFRAIFKFLLSSIVRVKTYPPASYRPPSFLNVRPSLTLIHPLQRER